VQFDRPYVLTPGGRGGNNKAYRLLAKVMERTNRAGMASFVMNGKERIVAILAEDGILRAETLRFADEIRTPEDVGLPKRGAVDRGKVGAFQKAIAARSKPNLAPSELQDPRIEAMRKLVANKKRRGKPVGARTSKGNEPIDLVDVLRRRLEGGDAHGRRG
jgi:DNA end-binding protein Ku